MCRLQPAAHFVRGSTADPWTTAGDCPDANQQREPIQRRTIRSDICILSICTPWKSANTYPPPALRRLYAPHPHTMWVAPHDPEGSRCPCSPPTSPSCLLSTPLTLSGLATIPDPAPETGWLEFKVNVPLPLSAGCPVRPLAQIHIHHSEHFLTNI